LTSSEIKKFGSVEAEKPLKPSDVIQFDIMYYPIELLPPELHEAARRKLQTAMESMNQINSRLMPLEKNAALPEKLLEKEGKQNNQGSEEEEEGSEDDLWDQYYNKGGVLWPVLIPTGRKREEEEEKEKKRRRFHRGRSRVRFGMELEEKPRRQRK
jgi:hypothetical protein